jgi:hypothetical protein
MLRWYMPAREAELHRRNQRLIDWACFQAPAQ